MFLLVGGSVAYAAGSSLPGDITYGVKINVTEPVKGVLTFGSSAKSNWQAEIISRRVAEAEELAKQGRLSGVSTESILNNINYSADNLNKNISDLKKGDENAANDEKIAIAVNTEIQTEALTRISNSDSDQKKNVGLVKNALMKVVEKVGMKSFIDNFSIGSAETDVNNVSNS